MKTIVVLCSLLCASLVFAQEAPPPPAGPLTLAQALAIVAARYPSIEAARASVDAARARTQQSAADRRPQVSVGGSYNYTDPRAYVDFVLPSGPSRMYESVADSYNAALQVHQLLTDFGRTAAAEAAVRAGETTAQDTLEQIRSQIGYRTIQSFYAVILLRRSVAVADDEIRALDESLRIARQKFAGGSATKFDVLTTQVRLATAQNRRSDTLAAVQRQEAALRQLLGYPPAAPLALDGEFDVHGPAPDLAGAISAGLAHRAEITLAHDAEKTAQLRLEAAQRANRPTLAADVAGGIRNGYAPDLYAQTPYVSAGVSVSIPIFTGGRVGGERAEARANLRAAQARTEEAARTVTADVENAFADLTAAEARLANADTLVAQAQEALSVARTRYQNGVITTFELLDAQSSVRTAELARLQARYDRVLARQAVAHATGQPPHA